MNTSNYVLNLTAKIAYTTETKKKMVLLRAKKKKIRVPNLCAKMSFWHKFYNCGVKELVTTVSFPFLNYFCK